MTEYDLNLRESWRVIKKRKFIIVFTIAAMGFFSFIFTTMGAPTPLFKATASVKIEKSASVTGLYLQAISSSSTDYMETQAAMIKSYFIMEVAAKRLGLIPDDLSSERLRANSDYLNIILDLKKKVEAEKEGNTDIINITASSDDQKFARNLANTVAQVYKEEHIIEMNKRTIESKKFIERQLIAVRERADVSEDQVRHFRQSNKLISLEAQSANMLGESVRLRAAYEQNKAIHDKIGDVIKLLDGNEDKPLTFKTSYYFDEAAAPFKILNEKLVQLMLERDILLLTYTEDFPQLLVIRKQIHEITGNMKSELFAQRKFLAAAIDAIEKQISGIDSRLGGLPEKGLELARLERDVAINREVYTMLEKKYQESLIQEAEQIDEVQIVKPALLPTVPVNPPKTAPNTVMGITIGLILGVVFAFFVETFDTSIAAIEDVEELLGVSVLGIIPFIKEDDIKEDLQEKYPGEATEEATRMRFRLISHFLPKSTEAESYRALRTSLHFKSAENNMKVLLFTSSFSEEGKTMVTTNIAIAMAQAGNKVLLVDGDLRKPAIARTFGINRIPGLTDIILGNYEWKDVRRTIADIMMGEINVDDIIATPGLDNLHIITGGSNVPNPAEIVSSRGIVEFIKQVRAEYDMVLIDTAPILAATDAAIWGSRSDGVIMVYQVGKIARGALKRAKAQLDAVKSKIAGVVLNGLKAEISPDFGYPYKYFYYYGDSAEHKASQSKKDKIKSWFKGLFLKSRPKRRTHSREANPSRPGK